MSKNYKNYQKSGSAADFRAENKEREDKAFNLFAEMLIKKIENSAKSEWKKPWFTEGQLAWPKALYGKSYHGMNALMLTLLCEKEGYKIPVFATRDRIFGLNKQKDSKGRTILDEKGRGLPAVDKDGNKLPFVHITEGQHSFPVFVSGVNVVNKKTREKIKWAEYVKLSQEEQKDYNVYHNRFVHYVFNVDQTNMKEARPELYQKLMDENVPKVLEQEGPVYSFEPLDIMVSEKLWICDIEPSYQDQAYYSPSQDKIVIPMKEQFGKMGKPEAYYGTMLHEMIHSTGAAHQLDRLKPSSDRDAYAREELVAELGAAMSCHRYGIDKVIKEDSIPYVQSWLGALHEKPDFIRTVLKDVKMATSVVDVRIDSIRQVYLGEKESDKLDVREDEESTLEFDEDGDAHLGQGESLGADKKQGAGEGKGHDDSQAEKPEEHRRGGMHR